LLSCRSKHEKNSLAASLSSNCSSSSVSYKSPLLAEDASFLWTCQTPILFITSVIVNPHQRTNACVTGRERNIYMNGFVVLMLMTK
jgi:hypothetical protein